MLQLEEKAPPTLDLNPKQLRLVITLLTLNELVSQIFLQQFRVFVFALIVPASHVRVLVVLTESFTLFSLELLTEVTTARLVTVVSVDRHQVTNFKEVSKTKSLFKLSVQIVCVTWDKYI